MLSSTSRSSLFIQTCCNVTRYRSQQLIRTHYPSSSQLLFSLREYGTSRNRNNFRDSRKRKTILANFKSDPSLRKKKPSSNTFKLGGAGHLKDMKEDQTNQPKKKIPPPVSSFIDLRLLPEIRRALAKEVLSSKGRSPDAVEPKSSKEEEIGMDSLLKKVKPTPIQSQAIKAIQEKRKNPTQLQKFLIAAETGSGKTWAYLAPLLHKLKEQEKTDQWGLMYDKPIIRSIIVLPTYELVDQVYSVAKSVEKSLGLHVFTYGESGNNFRQFFERLDNRIDILITTPSKLNALANLNAFKNSAKSFNGCSFFVVDEADTLLDDSWFTETYHAIQKAPRITDLVFCSATIPNGFLNVTEKAFPNIQVIASPNLHRIPKSIDFKVIDVSTNPYHNDKLKALAQVLYAIHKDGSERGYQKRVVVFVNNKEEIEELSESLQKYGHDVVTITGSDTFQERQPKIHDFIYAARPLEDLSDESKPIKVLVTTDLLARGLNFAGVKNVILYDLPKTSIDLVHRSGRTGRMMEKGRVILLVNKKENKSWVRGLPSIIKKGVAIA